MINDGYLKGMQCPKCGSDGPFSMEIKAEFEVFDGGLGMVLSEEFSPDDRCSCRACHHQGTTLEFRNHEPLQVRDYVVDWQFTASAVSVETAALEAWKAMRTTDSTANVFDVTDENGETVRVDVQQLLEEPAVRVTE